MGRELRRVALDFKWPLNQVWKGYLNPFHSQLCKACDGNGYNPETKKLSDDWYGHLCGEQEYIRVNDRFRYNNKAWKYHLTQDEVDELAKKKRLMDFTHVWTKDKGWQEKDPPCHPTAEEVNKWSRSGYTIGFDSCAQYVCVEVRAKRLGVYGLCEFCKGEGHIWQSDEIKKLHEEWKYFEPPKGNGFQLWETCSEGSPITPVFPTLKELCKYAEENATTFGYFKTTAEQWEKMLSEDNVCHQEGNMVFI